MTSIYSFENVDINDDRILFQFLNANLPKIVRFYTIVYDSTSKLLKVYTKELLPLPTTRLIISDVVLNKFPNPAKLELNEDVKVDAIDSGGGSSNIIESTSAYGYFPPTTAVDGDVVLTKNVTLTRNMYYKNLTIPAGITLKPAGWRIVVTERLILNGVIADNGNHAVGSTGGAETAPFYSTYLGPGSAGADGLSKSGHGIPGNSSPFSTTSGRGGVGGNAGGFLGGLGGALTPISNADGGLNALATMPTAFLGRIISDKFMISSGTGGGSGALDKGTATVARSGAGAGSPGLILVASRNIEGNGKITALGANGGDYFFSGTKLPIAIGGGAGTSGGTIIVITQSGIPESITLDVSPGLGGLGYPTSAQNGSSGQQGIIFKLTV